MCGVIVTPMATKAIIRSIAGNKVSIFGKLDCFGLPRKNHHRQTCGTSGGLPKLPRPFRLVESHFTQKACRNSEGNVAQLAVVMDDYERQRTRRLDLRFDPCQNGHSPAELLTMLVQSEVHDEKGKVIGIY